MCLLPLQDNLLLHVFLTKKITLWSSVNSPMRHCAVCAWLNSAVSQTAIFSSHLPTLDLSIELNRDLHPIIGNVCADKAALLFHFCRSKHFSLNEQCICSYSAFQNVIMHPWSGWNILFLCFLEDWNTVSVVFTFFIIFKEFYIYTVYSLFVVLMGFLFMAEELAPMFNFIKSMTLPYIALC